jgi:hypothetical protein
VALLLPKDAHHSRAVQAIEDFDRSRLSDVLLTTNNFDDHFSHRFAMRPGPSRK